MAVLTNFALPAVEPSVIAFQRMAAACPVVGRQRTHPGGLWGPGVLGVDV